VVLNCTGLEVFAMRIKCICSEEILSAQQPSVDAGNSEEGNCSVPALPVRVRVR
jgi:hypothetical protein